MKIKKCFSYMLVTLCFVSSSFLFGAPCPPSLWKAAPKSLHQRLERIETLVPEERETPIKMERNIQPHQLHADLIAVTKWVAEQTEDRCQRDWHVFLQQLDGKQYRLKDTVEACVFSAPLDLTREFCILLGKDWKPEYTLVRLDTRVDSIWSITEEITDLMRTGFGMGDLSRSDVWFTSSFDKPVIWILYDGDYMVGMSWAIPHQDVLICTEGGNELKTTVWTVLNVCCRPEYVGLKVGTYLMDALRDDKEVDFAALTVRRDNVAAMGLYKRFGFFQHSTLAPQRLFLSHCDSIDEYIWMSLWFSGTRDKNSFTFAR